MKRRSSLKYLCSVVPVAMVDPSWLIQKESDAVSLPTRNYCYINGERYKYDDIDIYESDTESLNDVLLAVIDRKGWKRGYVHIKTKD